jgi:hypothetical protein
MSSGSRTSAEDSSSHMTSSVFGDNMKNSSAGNVTVVLQVNSREHYDWLKSELGEEPQINLLPNLFNLGKAFSFFFFLVLQFYNSFFPSFILFFFLPFACLPS